MSQPLTIPRPHQPLRGGGIVLRAFTDADVPALVHICQDEEILRWTQVPRGYTERHAHEHFARSELERRAGREIHFAIADAPTDALLGGCDVRIRDREARTAELGYMIGPAARGRGAATAAVRLLTAWARDTLGMRRVEILAHPDNVASQRVARRAGFRREQLLREHRERRGRREDRILYVRDLGDRRRAYTSWNP